eukprot:TRINITY_DN1595_c0_g3_i2.p1 TRINITY_DN1595_c0_g3~~TRINITY_DN1595_c0_g3_i2.p1  ORF type:complete len:316 (+),score=67.26 TRINITY_DN1595_c0_g3_i2:278-1225(+)
MYGGSMAASYGGAGGRTSYGDVGASQFAGGGFMPTPAPTGGADGTFSPGGTSRRPASQGPSGLLPVTIRQLALASASASGDDGFVIDGAEGSNVTVVGKVLRRSIQSTDMSFTLDDFTGRIEIKRWIDGDNPQEEEEIAAAEEGSYVRVFGHLRSFNGKRNIVAFSIRRVTDFNELTFHQLECVFVHCLHNKDKIKNSSTATAGGGFRGGNETRVGGAAAAGYLQRPTTQSTVTQGEGGASTASGQGETLQQRILKIYEEPQAWENNDAGLHYDHVVTRLPMFSKAQIRQAIDFLVNEGLLYSTIDDNHFKHTSM